MEQREQRPERPGEDIDRAAAEAVAQAEAGDDFPREARADRYADTPGSGRADAQTRAFARPPRRWFAVGGVTLAALALAGTAVGLAGRSHHPASTTVVTVAASDPTSDSPTTPTASSPGTPSAAGTSTSPTTASSTLPPTTMSKTSSPPQRPTTAKSSTTAAPSTAGEGGDCESTTHDTPADESVNFTGMTYGARSAFLKAQKAAKAAGLSFVLNSGYRSAAYQRRVYDCWVKQMGSPEAARKYALPPDESAHVKGYAMDIAPPSAAAWLESTAGRYGLCRRYADESWHFEYQSRYKTEGCPKLLPQP